MAQSVAKTREQLAAEFFELDERFSSLLNGRSRGQVTWRPAAGAWSVTECTEHVALINSKYVASIKAAIADSHAPQISRDRPLTTAGWFSAFFLQSIGPQTKTKMRAPRATRPSSVSPKEALKHLLGTHQQIRDLLASTSQPDLNRVRFKNPFVPLLRFTIASAILIMAAHGRRHLLQAEGVCDQPGFPGAENTTAERITTAIGSDGQAP
jgi:hypothetical protein